MGMATAAEIGHGDSDDESDREYLGRFEVPLTEADDSHGALELPAGRSSVYAGVGAGWSPMPRRPIEQFAGVVGRVARRSRVSGAVPKVPKIPKRPDASARTVVCPTQGMQHRGAWEYDLYCRPQDYDGGGDDGARDDDEGNEAATAGVAGPPSEVADLPTCPITLCPFVDPVCTSAGTVLEGSALRAWIASVQAAGHPLLDPLTGERIRAEWWIVPRAVLHEGRTSAELRRHLLATVITPA